MEPYHGDAATLTDRRLRRQPLYGALMRPTPGPSRPLTRFGAITSLGLSRDPPMLDIVFLGLGLAGFALFAGLVAGLRRL